MAYMSQEKKKLINAALKRCIPKDWKWSLGVDHHTEIVLTIYAAPVDLLADYKAVSAAKARDPRDEDYAANATHLDINRYWYREHFTAPVVALLDPIFKALNDGNHNKSDLQSDYHDVGWYVTCRLGKWDKPFVCTAPAPKTIWNDDGTNGPVLICPPPKGWEAAEPGPEQQARLDDHLLAMLALPGPFDAQVGNPGPFN